MRPIPGETKKAIWLDHAGNIERFAADMFDVWDNGAGSLSNASKRDATPRKRDEATRKKVVCPECGGVLRGNTCMACGWERPARSGIVAVDGEMRAFTPGAPGVIRPRDGLRAEIAGDARKVWEAALAYCFERSKRGEDAARRWAYGIWRGIYPSSKLPGGWYVIRPPSSCDPLAYGLVAREQSRFQKRTRAA